LIVYVESNYVLELSLEQQEYDQASRILEMAERQSINLSLPDFALAEPYSRVHQLGDRQRQALVVLREEQDDLERRGSKRQIALALADLQLDLGLIADEEQRRLEEIVDRIILVAQLIPLTRDIVAEAWLKRDNSRTSLR
jgi:hypothetical protein